MILVDTAVWIDHLRRGDSILSGFLDRGDVLAHPWVTGELALGNLHNRSEIIDLLRNLPQAVVATSEELLGFVERHELRGRGIGYVDAQLLAATKLTDGARLWTRDRRLHEAATHIGCAYSSGD